MTQDIEIKRIDGIKWWITESNGIRNPVPLCPQHNLRLAPKPDQYYSQTYGKYKDKDIMTAVNLECAERNGSYCR